VTTPDGDFAPAWGLRRDVAFRREDVGKGEHVAPATYRNRIAASLQYNTGQSFGADKQQWLKWWHEKGASINLR
jgi:hypothetical protein